jgi:hypothetical protein
MIINDSVLVPDISLWVTRTEPREFEDGGCQSIIVGLYSKWVNGVKVLNPVSRQQCIDVATKTSMVLQGYFWDDIIVDPNGQADWIANVLATEGLPVKFMWADQEQWWTNWTLWYQARAGKIPYSQVPRATPDNISNHNYTFCNRLVSKFPKLGVYTNNGFVSSWSRPMNNWLPRYAAWPAQYDRQPAAVTAMSWEQLRAQWMPNYDVIRAPGQPIEQVKGHQFTGDRIQLPGSYDQYGRRLTLDVSIFQRSFIDSLRSGTVPPVVIPPVVVVDPNTWLSISNPNVRSTPSAVVPSNIIGIAYKGTQVVVNDLTVPYWIHFKARAGFPMGGWSWKAYWKQV